LNKVYLLNVNLIRDYIVSNKKNKNKTTPL